MRHLIKFKRFIWRDKEKIVNQYLHQLKSKKCTVTIVVQQLKDSNIVLKALILE